MPNIITPRRLLPVAVIACAAAVVSCSDPGGGDVTFGDGPGFAFDPTSLSLRTGDTASTVVQTRAGATQNVTYEWKSANSAIAAIQTISGVGDHVVALGVAQGRTTLDVVIHVGTQSLKGSVPVIVSALSTTQ